MDVEIPQDAVREAGEHLRKASMLLRLSKDKAQPYPINKCLDMMFKTMYDHYLVLQVLLEDRDREEVVFETKTPASKILDTYLTKQGKR